MKGHYVYKYVNSLGEIVYIGKCDTYLPDRIGQHRSDPYADGSVFYTELANSVEADALESLLINKYKPRYNKAKMKEGFSLDIAEPAWLPIEDVIEDSLSSVHVKQVTIANNLQQLRKLKGLKQIDIARAMGVTTMAVSSWEAGKRLPGYDTMLMLSDYLKEPLDKIFYRMEGGNNDKHEEATRTD